ncbi:sensor histidine kinase efflux regulator BaeS [Acinetobacter sp. HY1485]|uniref:sensor histidine kinase efflux regulator BaeS n=1 Tax=Acinetobacter sp. HY1485 TaxID=2970918 RepID=UPI0022B9BD69|nr:sensor histidine kinase efflux regulator BaeS [Acinetobacter sp. HY1485]
MQNRRIPIALRLFSTVLLTTVFITTVSLAVFQWTMKENFAKYVADVEMQKLDHLIDNLEGVYKVYHDWGDAIQAQILQVDASPNPENLEHLSRMWLRRQYDISLQQRYFKDNTSLNIPTGFKHGLWDEADHLQLLQQNLPSEYQPFDGFEFNRPMPSREGRFDRRFPPPFPDKLGLSGRLSLYDQNKNLIVGEQSHGTVSYREIEVNGKVVGYLGLKPVLNQDDALSLNFFSTQKRVLLLIYAVTVLASLLLAILLATYFKKPIHRLLKATQELTQGNYQYEVKVKRNDELGDLSTQINRLSEILYQHEQSRRQWVADTSHELKTPLSVLQAQIEAMQDGIRKATPEHLGSMMAQVCSLKKLTQDLSDLAQVDVQQLKCYFTEVDPWQIICQEIESFKTKFDQSEFEVTVQGHSTRLTLDQDRFKQILVNLLGNSIRYTERGGKIQIHTEETERDWTLYVDDSPLGLSDEQLERLGERFYRVDDSRTRSTGGTGLGLALSVRLAHALGGELTFEHSPLGGLRAKLTFNKQLLKLN